jgi:methanogen homoisocitrate dehydrogenase
MLLEWAGECEKASLVDVSVKQTISKGITTRDLGGTSSTNEVAREIIRNIR